MYNLEIDIFNSDNIFDPAPFISFNKNLKNFFNYEVCINIGTNLEVIGIDNSHIIDALKKETNKIIYDALLTELLYTNKIDCIDISIDISKNININQSVNKIIDSILQEKDYNCLITNTNLVHTLLDSTMLNMDNMDVKNNITSIYHVGMLQTYKIYCNKFMTWSDNRICLFNNCEMNIDNITQSIIDNKLSISYDLAFNISDSKVIFVHDGNENSSLYRQYKKLQRDIKINNLLDGQTTT